MWMSMQVIFMTGSRAQLLDRARYRRVDYDAGYQPFHITPAYMALCTASTAASKGHGGHAVPCTDDALSPPLPPLLATGFAATSLCTHTN